MNKNKHCTHRTWVAGLAVLLLFTLLCFITWKEIFKRTIKDEPTVLPSVTISKKPTDTFRNKDNRQIAEFKVEKYDKMYAEIYKRVSDSIFNLKGKQSGKVKGVVSMANIDQKATIPTLKTTLQDRIPGDTAPLYAARPHDSANPCNFTRVFSIDTIGIHITGQITGDEMIINSFNIDNRLTMREIEKKTGLFKKTSMLQAVNSNRIFETTSGSFYRLRHNQTAWSKWIKPTLTFLGGAFITYKLNK